MADRQPPPKRAWLRALARRRGLRVAVVLALPALVVIGMDVAMRGDRLVQFPIKYAGSYAIAVAESCILWGSLLLCASARRGRLRWIGTAMFVSLLTVVLGSQLYFYRQYSTYVNLDVTLFATSVGESVIAQLVKDGANFVSCILPPLLVSLLLVWLGRALVRTRRRVVGWLTPVLPILLGLALVIPCSYRSIQGSTPDVLYLHAMGGLFKNITGIDKTPAIRPKRRTPPQLVKLVAEPAAQRNVLFIVTESVRMDVSCSFTKKDCATPFSIAATPSRLPLRQMRANSSTTAIQLAVLWSGLEPTAGREPLHTAPLLFDYAHAAGLETAYWTSHHMMFANSRLFVQDLPTRFQCGATQLDPVADIDVGARDSLLTARIEEELVQMKEPFFAVAHYGNTHFPYLVDPQQSPFQPSGPSKAKANSEAHKNYYKNAVHLQDKTVADLIRFVRAQPFGERTVIVYTSDHGEQFREHGQVGHTCSLFDVELHVPTWIDAPAATLTKSERSAIESQVDAATFHTDITPTILDLMGLWDAPELAAYRRRMVGSSLLRARGADPLLGLSNCSGVWGCAMANWGVQRGFRKLISRAWDGKWLCYDVRTDPAELSPLDLDSCQDLLAAAERIHGGLPGR